MLTSILAAAPSNPANTGLFADATTAAVLAAVVSFLGLMISKESKISEFRQKWINALREDAATLVTHTFFVRGAEVREDADLNESYIQINHVSARIRLRLNPKEKETHAIIMAMNKMKDANHTVAEFGNIVEYVNEFVVAVQKLLKKEWERVKRGELIYKSTFWFSILAIVGFLYAVTVHYFHRTILLKPF